MRLKWQQDARARLRSAAIVAVLHLLLAYAFLTGLGVDIPLVPGDRLNLLSLSDPPPPPPHSIPKRPPKARASHVSPRNPEGAASPANRRNTPTELVAPVPIIQLPQPPILATAPIAGVGDAPAAGAAVLPGPGTGNGGQGQGQGSGANGTGTGGGGGGRGTDLRWISGAIEESDYPDKAYRRGIGGKVGLRFVVAPNGRVSHCTVTRSSGSAELDATTCRLILKRFRYRPARDPEGRAIASTVIGEHVWELGPEPPPREIEADIPEPD